MKRFLLILLVVISACKASQIPSEDTLLISMKKTPCMGTCPDYDISIYENGTVLLDARQHLAVEGAFRAKLKKGELKALVAAFEKSNFSSFQNQYTSNRTDLPTTFLTYRNGENKKTIEDYDGAPETLKNLEALVHELIEKLQWKKVKD